MIILIDNLSFSQGEKDVRARRADRMRGPALHNPHSIPSPAGQRPAASPLGRGGIAGGPVA